MPRIQWDVQGRRIYETGIDRGVLYSGSLDGIPWNGLVSVSELPVGGEPREYYLDGLKYAVSATYEEYSATIEAFSCPDVFYPCEGFIQLSPGLLADAQPRSEFGFSYRTLIGDDVQGTALGYRIHVVYNVEAVRSSFTHQTTGEREDTKARSWDIMAVPERVDGYWPISHISVDSRKVSSTALTSIENALYGSVSTAPRLPTVSEMITMAAS